MMTDLMRHVEDYLRLRRSLGFKLVRPGGGSCPVRHLAARDRATTITVDAAMTWAGSPAGVSPISKVHRLGAVRGFARYLHTIDPATEIPPADVFARPVQRPTSVPVFTSRYRGVLHAAGTLASPIRAATYQDAARTDRGHRHAPRRGDALRRDDVDLDAGVLTVGGGSPARRAGAAAPEHDRAPARLRRARPALPGADARTLLRLLAGNRADPRPVEDTFNATHHHASGSAPRPSAADS